MFERIVVGLDGSERSERALPSAVELATRLSLPLHLVRIADMTWLRLGMSDAALSYAALDDELGAEQQEAATYLTELAGRLSGEGLSVTTEVRPGFAARELLAATHSGDLLAMASHGRSGPARWLLGSVAEEVTRHADCAVLLVRAEE